MTRQGRPITPRGLQIVWYSLLVATVVYVWIAESQHPTDQSISQRFYVSICVVSICLVGSMFLVQKRSLKKLNQSGRPPDPKRVRSVYATQLALMGSSLALVLYGLVVRFAGATRVQALPFYIAGALLLLYFKPKEIGTDGTELRS